MIKIKYKDGHSPLLFIDRMRVKLNFLPGPASNMAHMALFLLFDDPECFWQIKIRNALTVMAGVNLDSVPNDTHHAHLTYRHANQQAQWMILELHPRDMGLQGFEDLHIILGQFIEHGWGSFVADAKVT